MSTPVCGRRAVSALALLLAVGAGVLPAEFATADGELQVRQARFLQWDDDTPPALLERASERSLPDYWGLARRSGVLAGWYQLELDLPHEPDEPWALLIPQLEARARIFVNGIALAIDGADAAEGAARAPVLAPVPEGVARPGTDRVAVRLVVAPELPGYLAPLRAGPASALRARRDRIALLGDSLPRAMAISALAFAALMIAIYRGADADRASGWIAASIASWALGVIELPGGLSPLPGHAHVALSSVALHWSPLCFVIAFHRLLGERPRGWERRWLGLWLAFSAVQLAVPPLGVHPVSVLWLVACLWLGARLVVLIARAGRERALPRARWLWAPVAGLPLFALHDASLVVGGPSLVPVPLSIWSLPVVTLVLGALFFARLRDHYLESLALNRELETRVEDARTRLERSHARLREVERAQAAERERERIMREMHDGVGGQLVSALALVEAGRSDPPLLAGALRDALDDLRLTLSSLDREGGDLLATLATLRERLEPRLARGGLRIDWRVQDLPPLPQLGPDGVLHAMRVVQEAITNALRHAGAHRLRLETGCDRSPGGVDSVFVRVGDDGGGLAEKAGSGRGLGNMRRRASLVGGELELESSREGTRVTLWIPIAGTDGGEASQSSSRTSPS